jgi:hypothetical protein
MPNHPPHQDAPGADAGDGSAPGAPDSLRAAAGLDPSGHRSGAYVDVYDSRHPADILHVAADVFAAFVARTKAGRYDHLVPDELKGGK